ncbi:MAG TPA: HipA domain-containing protein [Nocardioides sp.]|uniref:type II toxin-antitoxin system HipA family toxin n=1 Tax=uncultured Nocardioides sp. TaxID=198441 RepID=UPI000ECC0BB7|nr:HipA domain-containing protein [uncultured Nocardioides sp.]HCB05094.1 type II toxin-antitoxin system HipA family toxin [Nocardioides sp.]HRD59654.1 HipA domain-containing protein [Nocardioides sp.]HRI94469.1 HipA domain-containing protein [Nocardioides sp.]HRK44495.1 HipA domain-containing protein [Nocardioides sp.]
MTELESEELKIVTRADVYKADRLAGHLSRNASGGVDFTYTDEWVAAGGPRVATTLPVKREPVVTAAGAVPPFFAGLLPEGRRLGALRRSVKTSPDDELTLVLAVGGDTVGDVRIVPAGQSLQPVRSRLQVENFDQVRFADLLAELDIRVDRVGLPGVQDKVSAAMLNVPITTAGSQLLLKLNPREFKHLVENEAFFLGAARMAGIGTVDWSLVRDGEGEPGLAVTRFDRVAVDGRLASLAVEDGCQVLGLYPSAKYSVTTEDLLAALSAVCEAPVPAAAQFLAQAAFAYLTGNGDAHAKNFSVLQDASGRWQPAPAYDLPSSQPYGDTTMALSVGGRRDGNITGARYVALGEHLGVRGRAGRTIVDRVAASTDGWLDGVNELPFDRGAIKKLKRVIQHRQKMLQTG